MNKESFLIARPTDVDAMISGASKTFVGTLAAHGTDTEYTSSNPMDLRQVAFYLLISSDAVDKDGDMLFLKAVPHTDHPDMKPYCCQDVGMIIPDVTAEDLVSGYNKDCHVNPDNTIKIDHLQLTRALVQAAKTYFNDKFQSPLFEQIFEHPGTFRIKSDMGHAQVDEIPGGFTTLMLAFWVDKPVLTSLISHHQANHPSCPIQFSLTTLNQADYPVHQPTLN